SNVVGVLANERADAKRIAELVRIVAQEQLHGRADIVLRPAFDRELALSVGLPGDTRLHRLACLAAFDLDALGDDERRVEADAELPDQLRVLALVAGQPFDEALRAGMRNRAELLHDLV